MSVQTAREASKDGSGDVGVLVEDVVEDTGPALGVDPLLLQNHVICSLRSQGSASDTTPSRPDR